MAIKSLSYEPRCLSSETADHLGTIISFVRHSSSVGSAPEVALTTPIPYRESINQQKERGTLADRADRLKSSITLADLLALVHRTFSRVFTNDCDERQSTVSESYLKTKASQTGDATRR